MRRNVIEPAICVDQAGREFMNGVPHLREFDHIAQTDLSFEIWREIFRTIVEHEKKALETGETVALTLAISQRVGNNQLSVLCVEVVCAPNTPAHFTPVT